MFESKLPFELCNMIIQYTYEPQSISLTADIKNYCATKQSIIKLYKEQMTEDDEVWLANDLVGYVNRNIATNSGLVNELYAIFFKYIQLNTREQVDSYFITLMGKDSPSQINIMWGLFTIEERQEFYDIMS